ncbi:DUF685 domain-containing protein (plasmid) [Borreliella spielmanii]|uniref:Uncharacterized protein n=2 Tax=Borreliella TaxID=64895 RepID=B9X9C5_9SPIR|nr:DUF685 domain-containing protein [Borreliella spielmanii]EEF84004.1 conserved hypothetical protein [Borreliella spielmanii A14S]
MAGDEEKLLIDEEETVQIKDLNKVTIVKNTDLLLLDDGAASSNAITFKNFLETTQKNTFEGEGLGYFKEIIKSTIAEELAADEKFVEKIYSKAIDKLIGNDSDKLSNLFSKIKSRLTNSISSATLSRSDDLLIMSSSSIQKTPIPKQLLGVPSNFEHTGKASRTTLYPSDYENKKIAIDLENHSHVTLIFYKSYDDNYPIYLDIEIVLKIHRTTQQKMLTLQYSDESTYNWVYECKNGPRELYIRFPMYKGWYVQKRAYLYGDPVPDLAKL